MSDEQSSGHELATQPATGRAVALQNARDNMLSDVASHRGEISQFLKPFDVDYEFFEASLRLFLTKQMQDAPDFFTSVTAISFMEALLRIAMNGLLADGKEAAIAHYKGRATALFMRDGFVRILWRTGKIASISDQTVTRAEWQSGKFEYREGDDGYIHHMLDLDRKDSDEIVAAYCVVKLTNGESMREVVPKAELEKIAQMSRSPARKAWAHQMHRKAAIRRIMGKMPREKQIVQLLEHDDANYDLNAATLYERQASGVAARLPGRSQGRPGFAPGHAEAITGPLPPEALDEALGDSGRTVEPVEEGAGRPQGDGAPASREAAGAPDTQERVKDFLGADSEPEPEMFPGDKPPLTERTAKVESEIEKATTLARLDGIKRLGRDLWTDLDRADPEALAELDTKWDAKRLEIEDGLRR